MRVLAVAMAMLSLGSAELLTVQYRAVTLDPGQRRLFRAPGIERVTAASGRCVEEGMDTVEPDTFWVEATCGGVRTSLVWLKDGTRYHVMACAEEEDRPQRLLKLRQKIQNDVKAWKSVTACVRNGKVELWGWVKVPEDKKKMLAIELKYGLDDVKNRVELIEE